MSDFLSMFDYQGKTARILGRQKINTYQSIYNFLSDQQKNKSIPTHDDYLGDNELACNIYKEKYYLKDLENELIEKCPEDVFKRLASFLSSVESGKSKQRQWAEKFYKELYHGHFVPGGRVLAGAGDIYRIKTLANCFVTQIQEDDIDSIYKAAFECARTYSYGGGIGVDISSLRPKDSVVHNAADSSTGAVSFMELYSLTTGLIGQSGRRGALMLTIDVKHPDVKHFIKVKKIPNWVTKQIVEQCSWSGLFNQNELSVIKKQVMENTQVRFANISIKVTDEFMHAVDEERKYGKGEYIVYKKLNNKLVKEAKQSENTHYSIGIPSKDIAEYEALKTFSSFSKMQSWVSSNYNTKITKKDFKNPKNRDVFGDYIIRDKDENHLAVRQSGDFLLYFDSENTNEVRELIKAREIWDQFIEGNYKTAEPGLIFWSTMSKYSPSNYVDKPIICTNPCGEVPLEDGGACNLGSLNLSRFVDNGYDENATINWDKLAESTSILTRFLDNVVSWNETLNALEKQKKAASETRRLGLGVMGVADMLNQLGVGYDSDEAVQIMLKVMDFITNASYQASASLASEKGASPVFNEKKYMKCPFVVESLNINTQEAIKKNGLRNIAIMSIAPTGTISNIVLSYKSNDKNYIGVSGGVEPIFATFYNRRSESFKNKTFKVFHSTIQAYIDKNGLNKEIDKCETVEQIERYLPEFLTRTSHKIDSNNRVVLQGAIQKYIDHSISSTINLPEDVEPEVISDIYFDAWQEKLKGVTIYREGSRFPILSTVGEMTDFQRFQENKYTLYGEGDEKGQEVKSDDIIKLPNGKLTTVYHHLNLANDKKVDKQNLVSSKELKYD
ncbi:MAG: ribonucleoside-diphosphate reductase, adenosylcobalamin-dependent [Candidatus Marinimicrobia bacterium]|nr:ribonucleoside-diphosphate reductase, adenosylcobalamin-dependent [Candidatus Neomarinimicrobiota bacterium]|tara:strand:- start:3891 stop:6419 length:2529 start_codon:yes stop_codon:yes gene_type:complete